MSRKLKAGYLVKTKTGKIGRTYHTKGLVVGKMPVYLATDFKCINGIEVPTAYETDAILCEKTSLTIKGYLD